MITQDQLKEVQQRCEALNRYLDIPAKRMQYEEEQIRTQAPEFWEDQKRAEEQMKLVKGLEKWIKAYESCMAVVILVGLANEVSSGLMSERNGVSFMANACSWACSICLTSSSHSFLRGVRRVSWAALC